jgi:hypothetical protein
MKTLIIGIVIAAGLLVVIACLVGFGLSDFFVTSGEDVMVTKPWRPVARAALGFILIMLTIGTAGLLVHLKRR